jgi:hypothetical protein
MPSTVQLEPNSACSASPMHVGSEYLNEGLVRRSERGLASNQVERE